MAVNPDKNIVEQSLIARLIGKIKRIAIDMGDSVSAETSRAQAAEGLKADKVQGATAGNLAALDTNGNLTDSGSKAADFKTTQTPVADPSASGAGLEFIDSVSQDANGEITPHKKSVQDGTTAQKGVVKLSNAIDSTSTTEAATPKAVKDAYDELNNKIVARAVFLSQAEWAVQSQLPGDPAKVYYVENGTGEDAYTVYVWKESTSTYEEVDESSIDLDGYWHDSPTTTGNGNVVTDITLGNDGVPQIVKGITALTQHQDISGKLNIDGSNGTKEGVSALINKLDGGTATPQDGDFFVSQYAGGGSSNLNFYRRPMSSLWNYIKGKILGWYDWTRVNSGTGRYAKICSIADPASGTSYTVDVLVTHMTSYYAVTGLVRITVSHGSSSVQASILASDSSFYAVDSGNPPKVYTYVDGNGKRTFVFDTASAYQTAQGFVFRAVGGFSDKWSFFGDVGCSNDAADLGSIGTKQDALDVPFVFASYAKTAGHAATASSADSATEAGSVPWSGVNARPSTMCSPYFNTSTTGRYYKMLSTHGIQGGSLCNAMLNNAFAGFCVSLRFRVYTTSVMVDAYFTQLSVYARNIFETNGYPVVRAYKNGDNDISFILDMGAGYAENGIASCIADFSGVTDRDDYWFWEFEQQGYTSVQSSWGTEMTASPFSISKNNTAYYAATATSATTASDYASVGGIANALVGKSDTNHVHDDRYVRYDTNSQGLTNAQKSNARTNIGAGTSSLTLGDSSNTASPGNHVHGRLDNNGGFGDENWSVSTLDRIVIAKNNYNGIEGYLVPSALSFDGNESDRALTQSAEWKKFLPPTGDGSSVSVTPDGTSTGTDIGNNTTLKALAQKFKNLVGSLKALAFKDKVSDSDISGTISDSHIASSNTWNGKQNSLGINSSSGDTGKFLNERGAFVTPSYPSVPSVINNLTSTSTTDALSAAQGKALNDNKQANLPTSGTASTTYAINISGNAASASYATGASNYTSNGTISSRFGNVESSINTLNNNLNTYSALGFRHWVFSTAGGASFIPTTSGKKIDGWDRSTDDTKRKVGMQSFFIGSNSGDVWCELRVLRRNSAGTLTTVTFILKLFANCYTPITIPLDTAHFGYEIWIYKNSSLATGSITVVQDAWLLTGKYENADN